ncbi:MAG: DUF3054 domain-containing protein [Actinomycetota bacterium]
MSKPARYTAARSSPRPAPVPFLVAIDLLALVVFVVAGMRSHHEGTYATIFLRNTIPLLGSWAIFSAVLGAYRYPGLGSLLRTWIVAVPIGLVVRSLWVGSPTGVGRSLTFLAVGLAFTLLFLLIGRGIVALVTGRGYPERRRS